MEIHGINDAVDESQSNQIILDHPVQQRSLVLKNGNHFLVLCKNGMIPGTAGACYGLYADDTRFLSRLELSLNGELPFLLDADFEESFAARMIYVNDGGGLPEQSVMVEREIVIYDEHVHERITLTNKHVEVVDITLRVHLGADFFDMFEVRGSKRNARGTNHKPVVPTSDLVKFAYTGLDGKAMYTSVSFKGVTPQELTAQGALFRVLLEPKQSVSLEITISTESQARICSTQAAPPQAFADALAAAREEYRIWRSQAATITTSDEELNRVLERGYRDLYMLRQTTPRGAALAAGLPWFAAAFGRDQCITAMQTLTFMPDIARDVIAVLAAYQAQSNNDWQAMRRGKIMHELRLGEMARTCEIPFIPYYGTVDGTALWLMLFSRYVEWTGDLEFARGLWKK